MLINRDHRGWLVFSAVATVGLAAAYVLSVAEQPVGASGGSWPGLAFGILGTLCMVLAGLLSARKRVRTWRLGSAQSWMRLHIWLGLLALPCIWFHSGFALGGWLTTATMALFYVVIASGIAGLILQQFVPAAMTRRVPLETIRGQLDHVVDGLAADAYELVASIAGVLGEADVEQRRLAAEAAQPAGSWKAVPRIKPADPPLAGSEEIAAAYRSNLRPYLRGGSRGAPPDLRDLILRSPEEWRPRLDRLRGLCEEAHQLAVQRRLHRLLHTWLFVHAPLSLALFVLVAVHIVFALRY
ncbi:MAG: hypothetical protein ACRERC_13195 [Candidatus Binatia bacterium]